MDATSWLVCPKVVTMRYRSVLWIPEQLTAHYAAPRVAPELRSTGACELQLSILRRRQHCNLPDKASHPDQVRAVPGSTIRPQHYRPLAPGAALDSGHEF